MPKKQYTIDVSYCIECPEYDPSFIEATNNEIQKPGCLAMNRILTKDEEMGNIPDDCPLDDY